MQIRVRLLATAVALASFGVNAAPVYIPTTLSKTETCVRAVDWTAPKVTLSPAELVFTLTSPMYWYGFESERQQFAYDPVFPPGPLSIAPNGRPMLRDKNLVLWVLQDNGTWKTVPLFTAAQQSLQQQGHTWTTSPLPEYAGSPLFGSAPEQERRVVFDQHCHAYTVVNAFRSSLGFAFLLHSRDGGHSWSAYPLPGWAGDGDVRMEVPSSTKHRLPRPPVLILHKHAHQVGAGASTVLFFPKKLTDGTLDIGAPITVASTVCCGSHSGNDTQVVSDGNLVHFAYPGAPAALDSATGRIGTPQYVATFKRSDGSLVWTPPTLVGYGFDGPSGNATAANAHSQPALALDSAGVLHVVISGHDSQMWYRKSLQPHVSTSWSAAEFVSLPPHTSTYPSLVLDTLNQPHVISRSADAAYRFLLVHRMRNAVTNTWATQNVLVDPGRLYKVEWYHKATIDPAGRLFVSYSYYPANLFAHEATLFGNVWGFTLTKVDPACPSSNTANYCEYNGYTDVSPSLLLSWDNGTVFRPSTTPLFSQNPPAIEPHRELYPFITSILSGN